MAALCTRQSGHQLVQAGGRYSQQGGDSRPAIYLPNITAKPILHLLVYIEGVYLYGESVRDIVEQLC